MPARAYSARARALGVTAVAGLCTALSLLAGCSPLPQGPSQEAGPELTVFAASSTRVLNEDLTHAAAQANPPLQLRLNNAGSAALVQQLAEGAPADVLLTASQETMDAAVAAGTVAQPVRLATNTMVMVVPAGNPAGITAAAGLRDEHVLVLCDPQVPCGATAQALARANGLDLQPDSLESQVADVIGKVASGQADAGWVYSTDAAAAGSAVEVIDIPQASAYPTMLLGARTSASVHPESADALLDLLAHNFRPQWIAHGFHPVN
ncbi:substrate-binding domain-containing protein [Corynebacterium lizhenjunii]|uniref:Substrate-binding domain-containing protein n=1 Tax=Corynebacterium lizhenjunii TaxID=2709394 RepID=A0A7T0KGG8_9CORY|nr:substrate-binding domain-containing protein [Corynebacterium lizhenjunii]QPK79976.1 substrate-binding domain-containing protein [Corynebacterium lizhenjunii]